MIVSQKMVNLFLAAADYIEQNPDKYNWGHPQTCNCGILASIANPSLVEEDFEHLFVWSESVERSKFYCQSTGICLNAALKTLLDLGFTPKDIENLEYLENEFGHSRYDKPENVIIYFRQKAKTMQKQLDKRENKNRTVVVQGV